MVTGLIYHWRIGYGSGAGGSGSGGSGGGGDNVRVNGARYAHC